jgi:hypothetical protein
LVVQNTFGAARFVQGRRDYGNMPALGHKLRCTKRCRSRSRGRRPRHLPSGACSGFPGRGSDRSFCGLCSARVVVA